MRIPTSVIVMSLLTAAPFGLAIRDTLNKKPGSELEELYGELGRGGDYSEREARRDRELLEEYEREQAREEAERAAKLELNIKRLDSLYGTEKATPGSFFAGFTLGGPLDESVEERVDALQSDDFLSVAVQGAAKIQSVGAYVYSDYDSSSSGSTCEVLKDKLTAAWGPSVNGSWLNPTTHVRATLAECRLSFMQTLDATAWIAALPLDIIGKTAEKAATRLGPDAEVFEYAVEWSFPGIGYGEGSSALVADTENDKVYSFRVSADTDFDTLVQIRDAISAKLKAQPTRDEDSGAWVWKKKPGITLYQDPGSNSFTLIVGKDRY